MLAAVHTFHCEQGTTWDRVISVAVSGAPRPLSGWDGRMQVRPYLGSTDVMADLSASNGRIDLGADGSIHLHLSADDTTALTSSGVYDLKIISPAGPAYRIIEGPFLVDPQVTP
jgi:hypothetical protein